MADTKGVQSVVRTFTILEILCRNGESGVTEISKLSELSKTTVFRLLNTLSELGYVKKNPSTDNYGITTDFLKISALQLSRYDIRKQLRPQIETISRQCGETVHLVERSNNNIIYIDKIENSGTSFRMASYIGLSLPMIYTAGGKAILSHLSNDEIRELWNMSEIRRLTPKTITDFNLFLKEIELVRENGFAIDNEENETGVCCISRAVSDLSGEYKYAISVSVPKVRMTTEKAKTIQEMLLSVRQCFTNAQL